MTGGAVHSTRLPLLSSPRKTGSHGGVALWTWVSGKLHPCGVRGGPRLPCSLGDSRLGALYPGTSGLCRARGTDFQSGWSLSRRLSEGSTGLPVIALAWLLELLVSRDQQVRRVLTQERVIDLDLQGEQGCRYKVGAERTQVFTWVPPGNLVFSASSQECIF